MRPRVRPPRPTVSLMRSDRWDWGNGPPRAAGPPPGRQVTGPRPGWACAGRQPLVEYHPARPGPALPGSACLTAAAKCHFFGGKARQGKSRHRGASKQPLQQRRASLCLICRPVRARGVRSGRAIAYSARPLTGRSEARGPRGLARVSPGHFRIPCTVSWSLCL